MPDRILIVEDERITAEDLRDILTGLGYVVTAVVSTGADAIVEAEKNPPDLALMDIRIKGVMDGTETARILGDRFGIPIVYLTAHADRDTLNRAKHARPLGYLVKPFQEPELRAAVEIALHRHRQDRKSSNRQSRLNDVLSNLLLGVISIDGAEMVLLLNPAAEELTGWQYGEAVGGPVRRVFRLADADTGELSDLPLTDVFTKGELKEIREGWLVKKNGDRHKIVGNVSPVAGTGGRISGAVIVFSSDEAQPDDPFLRTNLKTDGTKGLLQIGRFQLLAVSAPMKRVLSFALRVARSQATTILLEGESGTGKDILAQFLHYSSDRASRPFIPVNCGAIPKALVESELFGHEKGSFTDARTEKKGLFELADGGTLFLDEVGELPPSAQVTLLRVLEDQVFRRVGGVEDIEVDVRVIAATNKSLPDAVERGEFRTDLFHRLYVIPITIPPLREREADILPLANHFVRIFAAKHKSSASRLSSDSEALLLSHPWPGNVRELRNVIERVVLLTAGDIIHAVDIQLPPVTPAPAPSASSSMHSAVPAVGQMSLPASERLMVMRALEKAGGNQSKAARLLGITRDMLRHRVKKMGLKTDF